MSEGRRPSSSILIPMHCKPIGAAVSMTVGYVNSSDMMYSPRVVNIRNAM